MKTITYTKINKFKNKIKKILKIKINIHNQYLRVYITMCDH